MNSLTGTYCTAATSRPNPPAVPSAPAPRRLLVAVQSGIHPGGTLTRTDSNTRKTKKKTRLTADAYIVRLCTMRRYRRPNYLRAFFTSFILSSLRDDITITLCLSQSLKIYFRVHTRFISSRKQYRIWNRDTKNYINAGIVATLRING